jgi:DNA-binding CsgD family transcriptional regulator
VLSEGIQDLFRAKMGAVVDIDPTQSGPNPRPQRVTEVGLTSSERRALWSYIDDPDAHDPFLSSVLAGPRQNRVVTRRELVSDDQWYGITLVEDYVLKAGLDDVLAGVFMIDGGRAGFLTSVLRASKDPAFTPAEADTMRLIQQGLAGWSRFLIDGHSPSAPATLRPIHADAFAQRLSPRLRELLQRFIEGKSEQQAADEMGLSRHTVHMHAKRLYKAMNVKTRAELVAKALRAA